MDHPFIHKKALDEAPSNAVVICPDRNHMKFVQRFYPQIQIVGFLPHGGKTKNIQAKPIVERNIDILYAGGISYKLNRVNLTLKNSHLMRKILLMRHMRSL